MSVKKLYLVPIDLFDKKILDQVRIRLEAELNIHTIIIGWETITGKYRSGFKNGLKYRSTEMINYFSEKLPQEIEKLIFLTTDDLYSPVFASYFGEAQLKGRVGIVSTFLIKEKPGPGYSPELIFLSRFEKVVIHEAGHLFGLKHCPDSNCVMKLSGKVGDIDIKSHVFCTSCTEVLINSTLID